MGNTISFFPFLFPPPKPTWSENDMPDLAGKVVIITGGNTGIGKETAKAMLARNAKVYLACRNRMRAEQAIEELVVLCPKNRALFLELDLANLASVRKCSREFMSLEQDLYILVNNGGILACPMEWLTKDGYDMQFGTNVIGHWLLLKLLMSVLLATHERSGQKPRVITVSSSVCFLFPPLNESTFVDGPLRRKLDPQTCYFQSKLGNVVIAQELARRYGDNIVSISLHPGNLITELHRHISPWFYWFQKTLFLYPVAPHGALTQLYAATAPEAADYNGKFLIPWARLGSIPPAAHDAAVGARLWEWLESETRLN